MGIFGSYPGPGSFESYLGQDRTALFTMSDSWNHEAFHSATSFLIVNSLSFANPQKHVSSSCGCQVLNILDPDNSYLKYQKSITPVTRV